MENPPAVQAAEEKLGISVIKEEMFATYRQTLTVEDQNNVPEAITYLRARLAVGGATGKMYVNMTQGGTNTIVTEEIGRIPIGGELEKQVDAVFGR